MAAGRDLFIGRQPILNRRQEISAFEVLLRDSRTTHPADAPHLDQGAARVAFASFGKAEATKVVGPHRGFVSLSSEILMSDTLLALPREKVVVVLPATVKPTPNLRMRCRQLRRTGHSLALDDFERNDPRTSLLEFVDFVKVDVLAVEEFALPWVIRTLRNANVQLIAERVEDGKQFERCRELGFEFFQGFHFTRAEVTSDRRLDPPRAALLKLMGQLASNEGIDAVAGTFSQHVNLGVNLLRLVNSAALARRMQITTVQHALVVLGERQLRRWLMLLLFAGEDEHGYTSPLLQAAAMRARLMESLTPPAADPEEANDLPDRAFLTGMLSLTETLLGIPIENILEELSADPEVRAALASREGPLGDLLSLAEKAERSDLKEVPELLSRLGRSFSDFRNAQLGGYAWVWKLGSEENADGAP